MTTLDRIMWYEQNGLRILSAIPITLETRKVSRQSNGTDEVSQRF